MQFSDLDTVTNAAIVVTSKVVEFPTVFDAAVAKERVANRYYLLVHNQEQKTIPIEFVRDLKNSTAFSLGELERQEIILLWADLLSPPAQHALLKLLEEPPPRTRIWLVTDKPQALLETIRSRCVRLVMTDPSAGTATEIDKLPKALRDVTVASIASANYSPLIVLAAIPKDRSEAIAWCHKLLRISRTANNQSAHKAQRLLLNAIEQLQQNANVKLALEQCLFQIKENT